MRLSKHFIVCGSERKESKLGGYGRPFVCQVGVLFADPSSKTREWLEYILYIWMPLGNSGLCKSTT